MGANSVIVGYSSAPDGFFREKNANSIFRKNETFLRSKKSRARGWSVKKSAQMADFSDNGNERSESLCSSVFKCEARRKATKRVEVNSVFEKSDEAFFALAKNNEVFLKPANDNFNNQNLFNQNSCNQLCASK